MPVTGSPSSVTVVEVSGAGRDDGWDTFVDRVRGGHHVQTSRWGEVKAVVGWRAVRILLRRGGDVVAGCQVLMRQWGPARVGYVTRGPLASEDSAVKETIDALNRWAGASRLAYLKVQPPPHGRATAADLIGGGFAPSPLAVGPTATVLVDLTRSPEEQLRAMRAASRSNIAKARRRGLQVRAGGGSDLPAFVRLVEATSRRQGFDPYPAEYYHAMWDVFSSQNRARLVIAEHGDEVLSALLLIGYGDTVVYKMGGWSGDRNGIHPNEAAHWAGMEWAREAGYRSYDLEGIDLAVATALARGDDVPAAARAGVTHFKLGFGGDVTLLPGAYDRSFLPVLSLAVPHLAPRLDSLQKVARRLAGRRR